MRAYEKEAWSASVARRALRNRSAIDYVEISSDPVGHLMAMVFTFSAVVLLALIVISVLSIIV